MQGKCFLVIELNNYIYCFRMYVEPALILLILLLNALLEQRLKFRKVN